MSKRVTDDQLVDATCEVCLKELLVFLQRQDQRWVDQGASLLVLSDLRRHIGNLKSVIETLYP